MAWRAPATGLTPRTQRSAGGCSVVAGSPRPGADALDPTPPGVGVVTRAPATGADALDPTPPEGIGVVAGSPRLQLTPGPNSAGGRGWRGGTFFAQTTANPCRAGGERSVELRALSGGDFSCAGKSSFCSRFRRPLWAGAPSDGARERYPLNFPKFMQKAPKKSLQLAWGCAIIQS